MGMPTEVPGAKSSANGELINRVQQLRLDGQLGRGPGASRGSWLPWVLCGMMAVAWVGVGARWYKAPDASKDDSGAAKQAGNSVAAANPQAGNQPTVPAGALVLQIKG